MDVWVQLFRELGYPITVVIFLIVAAYLLRQFLATHLAIVVQKEVETLRQTNAEQMEAARQEYAVAIEQLKATLAATADEVTYVRGHYANISKYSSAQAAALRQAYLDLFERQPPADIDSVIEHILDPVRRHLGVIDELTANKIYAVSNYLQDAKDDRVSLIEIKQSFWQITESAQRFVRADRIAYRLGLVTRLLKGVSLMKVKVLKEGVWVLGNRTNPGIGSEIEISEDEWNSADVQRLVREEKVGKVPRSDDGETPATQ